MTKVLFVGLDVHAETIAVATAEDGRNGEVRFYGIIANTADAILKLTKVLSLRGQTLEFCYEAGPCGYGVHRLLVKLGHGCAMVSPSLIPRKVGDRVKTDRRDAEMLPRLWRAGELTLIWTPNEEDEAMRDLKRTRKQTMDALKVAKQQLLSFLLRHGLRYSRPTYWTKSHWRWINELRKFVYPYQQLAFEELKRSIHQIAARLATLNQAIADAVKTWRFGPVVEALRALRGVDTTIAATLAAEIGDITRFSSPRQLMAWLGLVPSEHSSGSSVRRGRLTKTGNALARTMMVEAGCSYRHPAREQHKTTQARCPPAPGHPRRRLEGSGSADQTVSRPCTHRQTTASRARRGCQRIGRLCLGYCPPDTAPSLIAPRRKPSRAACWRRRPGSGNPRRT